MSRVVRDILTMAGTYLIIVCAFSSGLVFALSNHHDFINNYVRLNSTINANVNITAYAQNFGDTMYLLFWTILDPGPKEEILDKGTGMRDIAATFLLIAYQIVMIVVFFNLLIAIMNVTIQKYQDR